MISAAETGTRRVLLVEDHACFREALAYVLGGEPGFEVVGRAGSLAEARDVLLLLTPGGFDVALLDLRLPDGDGTQLIGELKEGDPRASVVVLSVVPEHAGAMEAGADGVLAKEATLPEIVGKIRGLGASR